MSQFHSGVFKSWKLLIASISVAVFFNLFSSERLPTHMLKLYQSIVNSRMHIIILVTFPSTSSRALRSCPWKIYTSSSQIQLRAFGRVRILSLRKTGFPALYTSYKSNRGNRRLVRNSVKPCYYCGLMDKFIKIRMCS